MCIKPEVATIKEVAPHWESKLSNSKRKGFLGREFKPTPFTESGDDSEQKWAAPDVENGLFYEGKKTEASYLLLSLQMSVCSSGGGDLKIDSTALYRCHLGSPPSPDRGSNFSVFSRTLHLWGSGKPQMRKRKRNSRNILILGVKMFSDEPYCFPKSRMCHFQLSLHRFSIWDQPSAWVR